MIRDLGIKNRSYRRFDQSATITIETPTELADLARLSGSAGNKQPLKYIMSNDSRKNALIMRQFKGGRDKSTLIDGRFKPRFFIFHNILKKGRKIS